MIAQFDKSSYESDHKPIKDSAVKHIESLRIDTESKDESGISQEP